MTSRLFSFFASVFLLVSAAVYAGDVAGKATLSGKAPAEKTVQADADPKCKAAHPSGVPVRNYIVDDKGGLANVFVYVKDGLAGKKFPAPAQTVLLDQTDCTYTPMVLGIQTGQTLVVQNSDDTLHNVHATGKQNPGCNFAQPVKGAKNETKFDKAEVFVKFKCDVHSWMAAYVGVVSHPFFAVTGADGSFKLSGLPDGEYTLAAVHPKAGEKTAKIKVSAAEAKSDFVFEAKP